MTLIARKKLCKTHPPRGTHCMLAWNSYLVVVVVVVMGKRVSHKITPSLQYSVWWVICGLFIRWCCVFVQSKRRMWRTRGMLNGTNVWNILSERDFCLRRLVSTTIIASGLYACLYIFFCVRTPQYMRDIRLSLYIKREFKGWYKQVLWLVHRIST